MISRRTLLIGAVAATAAACTSRRELAGPPVVDNPISPIDPATVPDQPVPVVIADIPESVVMVGDSISALSHAALDTVLTSMGFGSVTINAEPSRRIEVGDKKPTNGLDIVSFVAGADRPEMWVIELGTNDAGLYATDQDYEGLIDALLDVIGDDAPLVWVNTYRDDHLDGCVQFNDLLRSILDDRGNATIADWYQLCVSRADDILTDDGVHPNEDGILVFADMVRAAVAERLA